MKVQYRRGIGPSLGKGHKDDCWASLKPDLGIRALSDYSESAFPMSVSKDVRVINVPGKI